MRYRSLSSGQEEQYHLRQRERHGGPVLALETRSNSVFISCKLGGKCYKRLGEEGEKAGDSRALKTLPKKCRYHPGGDEEALKGLSWGVSYSDLCFRKIRLEAV